MRFGVIATKPSGETPEPLPIDEHIPAILDALERHWAVVVKAPPGTGKTTRVPPALLGSGPPETQGHHVLVLEPRRIAARAACRRIAAERGWRVGGRVGYQVRFNNRSSELTRLWFLTQGLFLRRLQHDPLLEGVKALVFDEFHERSLDIDLALAMVRQVVREVRPDLKLVLMSATLEAASLAAYLDDCQVVQTEGSLHPVRLVHLVQPDDRGVPQRAAEGVRFALRESEGDVLTFLPGMGSMRATQALLESEMERSGAELHLLHGSLPASLQDAALRRGQRRKVVLATNVAETSLTVDGVSAVVDTGLARLLEYSPGHALDRIAVRPISRAACEQRAGRAGRQGPGLCVRLWSKAEHGLRAEEETPEIRRVDLSWALLQVLAWGERDPMALAWYEPPDEQRVRLALDLLSTIGALAPSGLSDLGRDLASLPLHPRLGRLVMTSHQLGVLEDGALLAAMLSEREVLGRGGAQRSGVSLDVLDRLALIRDGARQRGGKSPRRSAAELGFDSGREQFRELFEVRDQLVQIVRSKGSAEHRAILGAIRPAGDSLDSEQRLSLALLAAFPDRLARQRDGQPERALMVGGRGLRLAQGGLGVDCELFLALEVQAPKSSQEPDSLVRQLLPIDPTWLPEEELELQQLLCFDQAREQVVASQRRLFRDLVLEERAVPVEDHEQSSQLLAEAASAQLERALGLERSELVRLRARLELAARWMPEEGFSALTDEVLIARLPRYCQGRRSFEELRMLSRDEILCGWLDHHNRRVLDRELPERIELPSGRQACIDYRAGSPPILAAKIQQLFGWREAPRLVKGRLPLLLHLLAPNGRPQQVTDDLAGFWSGTYAEVRRELRGRYPKHAWPEDPSVWMPKRLR